MDPALFDGGDEMRFNLISRASALAVSHKRLTRKDVRRIFIKWDAWCRHLAPFDRGESDAIKLATVAPSAWLYFAQSMHGGPIKIGISSDPRGRVASMSSGSPLPLRCIVTMPGSRQLELSLHRRLGRHRLHGEWFRVCSPLVKLIELCISAKPAIHHD